MAERRSRRNSNTVNDGQGQQNPYPRQGNGGYQQQGQYGQGGGNQQGRQYGGNRQGQYDQGNGQRQQYGQGNYYNQGNQGQYGRGQNYQQPNGYYEDPNDGQHRKKKRKKRRKILFAIEILLLLILAVGLFVFSKLNNIERTNIDEGDITVNDSIDPVVQENMQGYTNIALYGVDSREGKLEEDSHSDTIIIASINNSTKDVKLVSVYRDTYLDNTNGEYRKATECYFFGGPKRSMSMLNTNLDLDIQDFVTVDFSVVATVVDKLGGIEIDIQEDEITHLNNYQVEGSEVTGKEIVQVTSTGLQTLNGLQALSYCRIRYTEGSDYKRTERQRTVLEQILKKAKSTDLLTLSSLIDDMNILTSFTNAELVSLATNVASYDLVDQTGFPFTVQTANLSAGDCVIPVNLENNVAELHLRLFGTENYVASAKVTEISNKIISDTGIQ